MSYLFREGRSSDESQLQALGLISYGQFDDILTDENRDKLHTVLTSENLYQDLLKISKCFVCETDKEIVGMAYLIPKGNPTEIFHADWSYIRMVGVNPKFGGNGIGKQLMQMCIDFAKNNNEKIIALHTSEFMYAARSIYENLGFRQVCEVAPRYGMKYWLYKLEL
jgi:ribosomal protein S18 acetylase RimI-like enzyme